MGRSQRDKGARGQSEAATVLRSHGYAVSQLTCGIKSEDIIAEYDGSMWAVEVKNCATINIRNMRRQAREQAKAKGLPWWLLVRLEGHPHTFLSERVDGVCILRLKEDL